MVLSEDKLFINSGLYFKGDIPSGNQAWQSPSNIALIKYWGKRAVQLPCNPSISFTLSEALTETVLEYAQAKQNTGQLTFYLEGKTNEYFAKKTRKWFSTLLPVFPFVGQLDFTIRSKNTFPHSAGIASSASGISALALCLCAIERQYFDTLQDDSVFFKKASYVSRLGSGSACRSLFGGLVIWGKTNTVAEASDYYGMALTKNIYPGFFNYRDTILIVDSESKIVSSRTGHALMNDNPFAKTRFRQANVNLKKLLVAMRDGDNNSFIKIIELEALSLHAMMMTSLPYYLLMKPETLSIIEKIFIFRKDTGLPVGFTLDAGPNVHLLYPESVETEVHDFVSGELRGLLENGYYIHDRVGKGPAKLVL